MDQQQPTNIVAPSKVATFWTDNNDNDPGDPSSCSGHQLIESSATHRPTMANNATHSRILLETNNHERYDSPHNHMRMQN